MQYFKKWSQSTVNNINANSDEKHLALTCFKSLSTVFDKNLEQHELIDLFLSLKTVFEQTYVLSFEPENEQWEFLPDYIQAFASFICFVEFTTSDFICLQRGVINMIKSFPHLQYAHKYVVIDGMAMTFCYLKKTQYFDMFIENVVYQGNFFPSTSKCIIDFFRSNILHLNFQRHLLGVAWSCSHLHISSAEFLTEDSTDKILTVRNYFQFWKGIFQMSCNSTYDKYGFYLEDRKYTVERLTNELVKTLRILINKLNISVKAKEEELALTDFVQAFKVENKSDYDIFLNVVDFYLEIFNELEPKLFRRVIGKIINDMINKCLQNRLVSGFYKLLSCGLRIARKLSWFNNEHNPKEEVVECRENLKNFLPLLLNSMVEFKDELLISCLRVLLEIPVSLIKEHLPVCEAPFINVFTIGKSLLPLAEMGIETLERWQESIEPEALHHLLVKVLPYLDTFLRSKSLGEPVNTPTEKRRKTAQALKKRKVLIELEPDLVKIQRKILNFIGKQSLKDSHAFIFSDDILISNSLLGQYQHLRITLPSEDLYFDIHLDTFLPRFIDLAMHSSDRKTRTIACELLQATLMVFLGRGN